MLKKLRSFVIPKLKFATTSSVATGADYTIYLALFYGTILPPWASNAISYSIGMIINFILQKRFIFNLKRNWKHAFVISASFSLMGLGLSTFLIFMLSKNPFLYTHQYLTKALVTGMMFFYNFYTKKFSFEKTLKTEEPVQEADAGK